MTFPTDLRHPSSSPCLSNAIARMGQSLVIAIVALGLPVQLGGEPAQAEMDDSFEDSYKVTLDEAWQIVNREYVDNSFNHVDWQATRQRLLGREYTSRQQAYAALRGALRQLDDPYTRFLDPEEYAALTEQTAGEVSGIGLRLRRDSSAQAVLVTEVVPNSPADEAGLQVGDHIVMVDGQSTERLTAEGVSQLLRGADSSQVTLSISRNGGQPRTLILHRTRLEVSSVEHRVTQQGNRRLGYVRLLEFNAHSTEQMAAAIEALLDQQVEGFILDLRDNPGGLLQASIEISRLWLQRGAIVRTQDRDGQQESILANRSALTDLPLTVLVDGRSASSSEILTGALRDNDRATVVGSPTFGKALVQSLHGLSDGSGLAVTVAHYYTPDGTDISRKGIAPDVVVTLSEQERRNLFNNPQQLGTEADPQYMRAASLLDQIIAAQEQSPQETTTTGSSSSRLGQVAN